MASRTAALAATIIAAAIAVPATAAADPSDWSGKGDLLSDPRDPGNGTRAGKDLEIYLHPNDWGMTKIRFHAWDEKLARDNPEGPNQFARITYYSRNGTKYEWNVDVPPGASTPVQLGSDDDLLEGGDIYIKLCVDGTTDCSGSYHGIT